MYLYRVLIIARRCRSVTHTPIKLFSCLAHVPRPVILNYEILICLTSR
jgi:hypothetical protein